MAEPNPLALAPVPRRSFLVALVCSLTATAGLAAAGPAQALNCANFKTAIANASNGDVITLDAGLTCNDTYDLAPHPAPFAVTIQGAGAGATLDGAGKNDTILDAPGLAGNALRLTVRNLTFRNGTTPSQSGGAISAGPADVGVTIENSRFFGNSAPTGVGGAVQMQASEGGAPLIVKSSVFGDGTAAGANTAASEGALQVLSFSNGGPVVVSGNTFNGNSATNEDTGAALITASSLGNQTTTIEDNKFIGNTAHGGGGALTTGGSIVALRRNTFTDNRVIDTSTDLSIGGAFLASSAPGATLEQLGNRFLGNQITRGAQPQLDVGGGGEWTRGYKLTSRNDRFVGNSIPSASGTGDSEGAGLGIAGCTGGGAGVTTAVVENAVVAGNTAGPGAEGAGLYAGGCLDGPVALTLINSTVSGNKTSGAGAFSGLFGGGDDRVTIRNSIVAGNPGGTDFGGFGAGRAVSNSDVCAPGVVAGSANICATPKLKNAAAGNVHQTVFSPTINKGANVFLAKTLTTDFEGNRRIQLGTVDMGADELRPKDDPFKGVKIVTKSVTVKDGVARVRVRCPSSVRGPCKGDLRLVRRAGKNVKKLKFGHHSFTIKAGKGTDVAIEITEKGIKALDDKGSVNVRATATAKDGIGTKRSSKRKVKLKV